MPEFISTDVTRWLADAAQWLNDQSDFALILATLPAVVISLLMFVGWAFLGTLLMATLATALILLPLALLEFVPAFAILAGIIMALAAIAARIRRNAVRRRIEELENRILKLETAEQTRQVTARTWEPPA